MRNPDPLKELAPYAGRICAITVIGAILTLACLIAVVLG